MRQSSFRFWAIFLLFFACDGQESDERDTAQIKVRSQGLASDADSDGVPDSSDNCPKLPNANQANGNGIGPGDACEVSLVLSSGLLNQYARFQSHKELLLTYAPLTFSLGPDLLKVKAKAPTGSYANYFLLTQKLGMTSLGELLTGSVDTISGSEVLSVGLGSDTVLGGGKGTDVYLRISGSATISVAFFDGTTARGTQSYTNSESGVRRFTPSGGVLFDRVEIRATAGKFSLVGPNEAVMFALGQATLPCSAGYERVGSNCVDINECAGLNHVCDALTTCTNTQGAYICGVCPPGYTGTGATSCVDTNECSTGSAQCSSLVTCSNTPGSYLCGACPSGYRGDGHACSDIDECAENLDGCDALVTCTNRAGGYDCGSCPSGYSGGGNTVCVDIDECTGPGHVCDSLVACTNAPGSYTCGVCPTGYRGDGRTCADIDECSEGSAQCSPLVQCGNTTGSYQCGSCPNGFSGDGRICADVDECANGSAQCAAGVVCSNTVGGYTCGACPSGYGGDGHTCTDIDECATSPCDARVICSNAPGGFSCGACPAGFRGDGYAGCVDIDECAEDLDICSPLVTCGNTLGSFQCDACPEGYQGDGHFCADVDECATGTSQCDVHVQCDNTEGGYTCGECPSGYDGNGSSCVDIDECLVQPCDPLSVCVNMDGAYECGACPSGYAGDGYMGCLDIDECTVDNGGCPERDTCVNTDGGHSCEVGCLDDDSLCNGQDDDCDGQVDEDYPVADVRCGGGLCRGQQQCVGGAQIVECFVEQSPFDIPEACNGLDDDCDGEVDESFPTQRKCGLGACAVVGYFECDNGHLQTNCPVPALTDPTCDGIDEDCDNRIDDEYPVTPITCGVGACLASGTRRCQGGSVVSLCTPKQPASNDVSCNNVDEDCNGTADEDFLPSTVTCGVGACSAQGVTSCVSGVVVNSCQSLSPAGADNSCNGVDDNCSGATDEGFVSQPTTCGAGQCTGIGATSCVSGHVVDSCRVVPNGLNDANCNGVDEDCDGVPDDDFPSQPVSCENAGCLASGAIRCLGGVVTNTCVTAPVCDRETSCQDAQDNDGDGRADCDDPDCGFHPYCYEDCDNGTDDDSDGMADCLDSACQGKAPCIAEICGNGLDDDGDARPDCTDSDCAAGCPPIPVDPSASAPPVPAVPNPSILDSFSFFYEGAAPAQVGVTKPFSDERASLVSFSVVDRQRRPLAGVTIQIRNHPEWGYALTRADGTADLVVDGGLDVVIEARGNGLLAVHRRLTTPWRGYASTPELVMTPLDERTTVVNLAGAAIWQVARGSTNNDSRGLRQDVLLMPAGTTAQMVRADGSLVPLPRGTVRITEYTVGPNGPDSMPAAVPPNTAYTHAFELSMDEAIAIDAKTVMFSQPLPLYVENFTEVRVGTEIPFGFYDPDCECWKAERNARVVEVMSTSGGTAMLDVTGDHVADTGVELQSLGITDEERSQLATLYAPGQTLWRVRVSHFSAWDINHPLSGAGAYPWTPDPLPSELPPDPESECTRHGSVISCGAQALGESVPIVGTPYRLEYDSGSQRLRYPAQIVENVTNAATLASTARVRVVASLPGTSLNKTLRRDSPTTSITLTAPSADDGRTSPSGPFRTMIDVCNDFPEPVLEVDVCPRDMDRCKTLDEVLSSSLGGLYSYYADQNDGVTVEPTSDERPTLGVCRRLFRWMQPTPSYRFDRPDAQAWNLNVVAGNDPAAQSLRFASGGVDYVQAEPSVERLGVEFEDGPFTHMRRSVNRYTIEDVLGDGTTFMRAPFTSLYMDTVLQSIGAGEKQRSNVSYCIGGADPAHCPVETGPLLGDLTATAFDPDGQHVYVLARNAESLVRFRIARRLTSSNPPQTVVGFVDGEFVLGGSDLPPSPTYLQSSTSGMVSDTRGFRLKTSGNDVKLAATGEGIVWALVPDSTMTPDKVWQLWRIRPNYFAERVVMPALAALTTGSGRSWTVQLTAGPENGVFVRMLQGGGGYGQVMLYWVQSTGEVRPVYATSPGSDCDPAVTPCERGPLVYDRQQDRIVVGRVRGSSSALKLDVVSLDYRTFAATAGGADYYQAVDRAELLYHFEEKNTPFGKVWPWRLRLDSWWLLPNGTMRTVSDQEFSTGGGLNNLVDLSTKAAASARTGKSYEFGSSGQLLQTRDLVTGRTKERFIYSPANRQVSAVLDADNNQTNVERNAKGLITAIVGPYGHRTVLEYDANSRVIVIRNPAGKETRMTYHAQTQLLASFTDEEGETSRFEFDELGRLTRDENAEGVVQTLDRNNPGVVTHRDEDNVATGYEPMSGGGMKVHGPDGLSATHLKTDPEIETQPDGTVVTTNYVADPVLGLQGKYASSVVMRTPSGRSLTTLRERTATTDDDGQPLVRKETTRVGNLTWTKSYDFVTHETTLTTPLNRSIKYTENVQGHIVSETPFNLLPTASRYDVRGRLIETQRGNRLWRIDQSPTGPAIGWTAPLGLPVHATRDELGRITALGTGGDQTTGLRYDDASRVVGITPPGRAEYVSSYREDGRLHAFTAPLYTAEQSNYTPGGRTAGLVLSNGQQIATSYDGAGRVQTVTAPNEIRTLAYSSTQGWLRSITSQSGWSVTYDNDGDLPLSETLAYNGQDIGSVRYEYDSLLRADRMRVNGSLSTTLSFDSDGLVVGGVLQTGAGSANLVITRNATNGLATTVSMVGLSTGYTYNDHGEELTRTTNFGASVLYATTDVVRDDLGRIAHEVRTVLGEEEELSYGYDGLGRLESVTVNGVQTSYAYDLNGNRLTRTTVGGVESGQYDGADRAQTYGDYTYTFDGLGALSTKTQALSGAQTQYAYDVFGALRSVGLPNGTVVEYEIDAAGRRVGRRVNGALTRRWLYAGSRIVAELGTANEVVSRFMHVEHGHVPDAMVKGGIGYRLVTDVRGSVVLVVNAATGAVAQQLAYDEFGRVLSDTNPGFQPFGFAGGLYDSDTGLVRFGARDYDAVAGRWTSRDPILFEGGDRNLHVYVGNDPVNRIDPAGLDYIVVSSGTMTWVDTTSGLGNHSWNVNSGGTDGAAPITSGRYTTSLRQRQEHNGGPGDRADWGPFSYPLSPDKATGERIRKARRTGGFHIHGGTGRGTHGCVEFEDYSGFNMGLNEFDQLMQQYNAPISVIVR